MFAVSFVQMGAAVDTDAHKRFVLDFMALRAMNVTDSVTVDAIVDYGIDKGLSLGEVEAALIHASNQQWILLVGPNVHLVTSWVCADLACEQQLALPLILSLVSHCGKQLQLRLLNSRKGDYRQSKQSTERAPEANHVRVLMPDTDEKRLQGLRAASLSD
ncbi:hypothetical protein NXC14_PA00130 (plasmid) [Rhizobium sp. NXC14]|uniref:hypothetical protein n=1 Tax=Rhizobium sp. NXC14 TaxID=1981173 RepID=UPI000A203C93|nr:hypothetical protein [Rhizobium sp. NXC14]ARO32417.1 hypothetical protein NXC14_PA00130 [Rhizobium sp. NXC14]